MCILNLNIFLKNMFLKSLGPKHNVYSELVTFQGNDWLIDWLIGF
jgi:hypothetical protein